MRQFTVILLFLQLSFVAELRGACEEIFGGAAATPEIDKLSVRQRDFLLKQVLPVVGRRLFWESRQKPRLINKINASEISFDPIDAGLNARGERQISSKLVFEWVTDIEEPMIVHSPAETRLQIPKNYDFSRLDDGGRALIQSALIGHPLHPYIALRSARDERLQLGEPRLFLKQSQKDAIKAGILTWEAIRRNPERIDLRSFGIVAPTAVGKTEILKGILKHIIENSRGESRRLHFVMAYSDHLIRQLHQDVKELAEENSFDFNVHVWGGKDKSQPFDQFMEEQLNGADRRPVFVVTTAQSLKLRLGIDKRGKQISEKHLALLRDYTASLTFDEVHHSGAKQASQLIDDLVEHPESRTFFIGMTGTPMHHQTGLLEKLSRTFWAYLDNPEDILERPAASHRPLGDMIEQVKRAIGMGELPSYGNMSFLDINQFKNHGPFFDRDRETQQLIINPAYQSALVKGLRETILRNKSGFITVPTITAAEKLLPVLREEIPELRFTTYHSGNQFFRVSPSEQEEKREMISQHQVDYILTVRKLDEGINLPWLRLWINLNRSSNPRAILQRQGRTMRISFGKHNMNTVSLTQLNEAILRDSLELFNAIAKGAFSSPYRVIEKDEQGDVVFDSSERPEIDSFGGEVSLVEGQFMIEQEAQQFASQLIDWSAYIRRKEGYIRLPEAFRGKVAGNWYEEQELSLARTLNVKYLNPNSAVYFKALEPILAKQAPAKLYELVLQAWRLAYPQYATDNLALFAEQLIHWNERAQKRLDQKQFPFGGILPFSNRKTGSDLEKALHRSLMVVLVDSAAYEELLKAVSDRGREDLVTSLRLVESLLNPKKSSPELIAELLHRWIRFYGAYRFNWQPRDLFENLLRSKIDPFARGFRKPPLLNSYLAQLDTYGGLTADYAEFLREVYQRKVSTPRGMALMLRAYIGGWILSGANETYVRSVPTVSLARSGEDALFNNLIYRKLEQYYYSESAVQEFNELIAQLEQFADAWVPDAVKHLRRQREKFQMNLNTTEELALDLQGFWQMHERLPKRRSLTQPMVEYDDEIEQDLSHRLYGSKGWSAKSDSRRINLLINHLRKLHQPKIADAIESEWQVFLDSRKKKPITLEEWVEEFIAHKQLIGADKPLLRSREGASLARRYIARFLDDGSIRTVRLLLKDHPSYLDEFNDFIANKTFQRRARRSALFVEQSAKGDPPSFTAGKRVMRAEAQPKDLFEQLEQSYKKRIDENWLDFLFLVALNPGSNAFATVKKRLNKASPLQHARFVYSYEVVKQLGQLQRYRLEPGFNEALGFVRAVLSLYVGEHSTASPEEQREFLDYLKRHRS